MMAIGSLGFVANLAISIFLKKRNSQPTNDAQTPPEAPIIRSTNQRENEAPPPYSEVVASQTTRWQRVRAWCGRGGSLETLPPGDRR